MCEKNFHFYLEGAKKLRATVEKAKVAILILFPGSNVDCEFMRSFFVSFCLLRTEKSHKISIQVCFLIPDINLVNLNFYYYFDDCWVFSTLSSNSVFS